MRWQMTMAMEAASSAQANLADTLLKKPLLLLQRFFYGSFIGSGTRVVCMPRNGFKKRWYV